MVRLQCVFLWLGLTVAATLLCFHLYLQERREVWEVWREVGKMKQRKEAEGGGEGWEAPVVEGLMSEGKGYKRGEVALRRLSSVGKSNQLSDAYNSSKIFDDVDTASERNENSGTQSQHEIQTHQPTQTGFRNQSDRFAIRTPFSLPTPGATLPLPQLLQCEWLTELRDYLNTLPSSSRLVSIVSSDYKYREVLLNWLLTARVKASKPLSNVLVLSLDQSLHQLLRSKDIACVHIPTTCLLRPGLRLTKHVAFTQVHIMRVLVMRLLNHWGYDVANYDSDALILKNPEPRFAELSDYHLIGSVGHFPKEMDRKWGTAVCIGVVLTRATPQTESYWETLSGVIPDNTNDQARLNWALDAMQMVWDNPHSDMTVHTMQGQGRGQFRAAVLPARDVCRQSCTKKMIRVYYIWHKGGAQNRDGKKSYASKGGLWYLHSNWEQISHRTTSTGTHWLRDIAR